jgi:hypothetical protein
MEVSKGIYSGVATIGRVKAVVGAVIGLIVGAVLIIIGVNRLRDKHTAAASATVTKVHTCDENVQVDRDGGRSTSYECAVDITFRAPEKSRTVNMSNMAVSSQTPLVVGSRFTIRYNPSSPTSVAQEISPKPLGVALIVGGILVIGVTSLVAFAAIKYKPYAAAEGAIGIAEGLGGAFRR